MLKKQHRLAKTTTVEQTMRRGRSFFNPHFVIKFRASHNAPRFTVIVSTKVSKKAVDRNRLKRLLREVIRLQLSKFRGGDYVIIVKPIVVKLSSTELKESFSKLVKSKFFL